MEAAGRASPPQKESAARARGRHHPSIHSRLSVVALATLSPNARYTERQGKLPLPQDLRLALSARAFPSTREEGNLGVKAPTTTLLGPRRLWIIIVNIIIIIIIVGWALRACDGARADELSKDYRALRT